MPDETEHASCSTSAYRIGDTVDFKRYGKAIIVAGPVEEPGHKFFGRYQVKYLSDGTTYWANPDKLRIYQQPPARVLVCESTKHYRSAALQYAHPDDVVLEVGCHEGVTTDILHQRVKWVVGIDIADDPLSRACAKYPHVRFEKLDGFDTDKLCAMSPTGTFDKIFIDIGGIAELQLVMSMVGLYFRVFKGACLIVKNRYMKNLLDATQVYVPPAELAQKRAAAAAVVVAATASMQQQQ